MSSRPELKLDWCSYQAAKYAVEHWHYSKCIPAGKLVKIGVWENGEFIGVVIFGRGTCGHLCAGYGLTATEGCELVRIALKEYRTPVSRIVAISLKMLCRQSPGTRLVVSFASKIEGHHGGIYQGGNWIYTGETAFKQEFAYKGKRMTDRQLSGIVRKTGVRRRKYESEATITRLPTDTKHRYLMPLDEEIRQRVLPLAKPYPKRKPAPEALPVDAPRTPAGKEGGSSPTSALQRPSEATP